MIITIPNTFSAGAVIVASQHNSNFSTIYSDYNGFIDNNNIASGAAIAYSKLNLATSIVNADVNASAAIVDTKLAQITTASKVHGTSITGLPSLPSGAGIVPVANLGSGTPTAAKVLLGDGSWGTLARNQLFTSSGTFTGPTGITKVYLTMVGAGAGGGNIDGGGGGAGGYIINYPYTVVAASTYTVTINAGGAGGAAGGTNNGAGGGTTVFDTVSVPGGSGGTANQGNGGAGGGTGYNASATVATASNAAGGFTGIGGNGAKGINPNGGGGGGNPFSAGTTGPTSGGANGTDATANTGAGGSGSSGNNTYRGGNGATGFCLVEW